MVGSEPRFRTAHEHPSARALSPRDINRAAALALYRRRGTETERTHPVDAETKLSDEIRSALDTEEVPILLAHGSPEDVLLTTHSIVVGTADGVRRLPYGEILGVGSEVSADGRVTRIRIRTRSGEVVRITGERGKASIGILSVIRFASKA